MGSGLDFGDAPAPYPVLKADNGARHEIVEGFMLGNAVYSTVDGRPSDLADSDLGDDGVEFLSPLTAAYETRLTVFATGITAEQPGYLDAWLDANRDGDWNDAGEKILWGDPRDNKSTMKLVAGDNPLTFKVIGTAVGGSTYMRFRFSSIGGLSPTGGAADGEVEDYVVTITSNPWHNSATTMPLGEANRYDVSGDGFVSPVDVLHIINLLNDDTPPFVFNPLPVPQPISPEPFPYYDVNGDGDVSAADSLMVISYLNWVGRSEAEGEAEAEAPSYGLATTEGRGSLVDTGLDAGLLGGSLLVTPGTSAGADVVSAAVRQAAPIVDTQSVSPATGYPGSRVPSAELLGRDQLTDLQAEDLEDLLKELVGETGDLAGAEDAHDAIFARFGA
jgi:hypothetical protein